MTGAGPRPTGRLRVLLVAIGEPGHTFPMIAIGRELRSRGHEVAIHTWIRWREQIQAEGLTFIKAPKFETAPGKLPPSVFDAAALAATELAADTRAFDPDVVISDVLTLGGALAAELCELPLITFVPHFWHISDDDQPPFGSGWAHSPHRPARQFFKFVSKFERRALEFGRQELNQTRARIGLAPVSRVHGGVSDQLVLVGTLPQLEPARSWPEHVKVVGPVIWEPPAESTVIPEGKSPLVVVAPSTAQDLDHSMLNACVSGLAPLPVSVLASKNGREPERSLLPGANTKIVDWVSYSQTFPRADVIVCHGGHGTVMRALTEGTAVVICPASGDQFETAARLRIAGVGVAVPHRFMSSRTIAAAVEKVISSPEMTIRARKLGAWAADNPGSRRAVDEIEQFMALGRGW